LEVALHAIVMLLLGGGAGIGVILCANALRPATRPIGEVFESVARPGRAFGDGRHATSFAPRDAIVRIGTRLALGLNEEVQLRKDLAVTGSTLEQHALIKAGAPALALLGAYVVWILLLAAGVVIAPIWATFVALSLAAVAFVLPDIRLRGRARERRVGFRHALSAYLDLVTIIMSGGGGLLTALQFAADAGDGWAFAEIRAALDRARLSNRTPWSQLGVLGDQFDIAELKDLAAAAELAGSEGSRITESIATKAEVLRSRLQAEVEHRAEALTEQMLLPVGLLLVALFFFLGFAVFQQLGGNTQTGVDEKTLDMFNLVPARRI
jgi:tight adherence protein C